jgi:hypothetical protein
MTETIIDERKIEVAARINVQADRIKTVQLQLKFVRNQGILVDLSTRAGCIKLSSALLTQISWEF